MKWLVHDLWLVHTAAAEQRGVGGVDDRINRQRGDIGVQRTQQSGHDVAAR
jgi:hypothetical protein